MFSEQKQVQQTIQNFLLIIPISYGLSGIVVLINVSMNVLGKPKIALYINLIKLLALCLPLALIGAHFHGLIGLFISIAVANILAFILALWFLKKSLKSKSAFNDAI